MGSETKTAVVAAGAAAAAAAGAAAAVVEMLTADLTSVDEGIAVVSDHTENCSGDAAQAVADAVDNDTVCPHLWRLAAGN